MKTVRILGMAPNLRNTPPSPSGIEVWLCNNPKGYNQNLRCVLVEWTRYFNLHSRRHMKSKYPANGYRYYQEEGAKGRLIVLQEAQPDIPGSIAFPRETLQEFFKTSDKPQRYFTCSVAWFIALAIYEGFERIELWGFELRPTKALYYIERPCFFYWVERARRFGVHVILPPELDTTKDAEPGDPNAYEGPLYGFETT